MCRSCQETPDGVGRRCPSRENGFTAQEADQRTRSRGLNSAQTALSRGDSQGAANALARAVSAQRELDGALTREPQVSLEAMSQPGASGIAPVREFTVAPADYATMRVELDNANADRASRGLNPLQVTLTTQRKRDPQDPMMQLERVRVQIGGIDAEEAQSLSFKSASDGVGRVPDAVEALAGAYAIARSEGGYRSKADAGADSTASKLESYLAAAPDSPLRQAAPITDVDRAQARETIEWARQQNPTSQYISSVKESLSSDVVSSRNIPLAVSAIPLVQREKVARQRRENTERVRQEAMKLQAREMPRSKAPASAAAASGSGQYGSSPVRVNAWIGRVGMFVQTTGTMERVSQVENPRDRTRPYWLYTMSTDGGASVKWFTHVPPNARAGDRVTVSGRVAAHEEFAGMRQTRFENGARPLVHVSSRQSATV